MTNPLLKQNWPTEAPSFRWAKCWILLIFCILIQNCSPDNPEQTSAAPTGGQSTVEAAVADQSVAVTVPGDGLPKIQFCEVLDPQIPVSSFTVYRSPPDERGDHWVRYECKSACIDWRECLVPAYSDDNGQPLMNGRDPEQQKQAVAFVVDGMGGHLVFSSDGDKTVFSHAGAGGTRYLDSSMFALEQQSTARTVMLRWEKGYIAREALLPFPNAIRWGWFSRTSEFATNLVELNKRVASMITWVHANLSNANMFATVGCSMGTNATFGAVLWHALDPIIDYQVFVGGPNMWDMNAQCGRRSYASGYCDLDGVTACSDDDDCASVHKESHCVRTEPYPTISAAFSILPNYIHKTDACDVEAARSGAAEPYAPFDESSMGYSAAGDWQIEHAVDFVVNLGSTQGAPSFGPTSLGGDEYWELGAFPFVFNRIETSKDKQWHTESGNHCDGLITANALLIQRMDL